MQFASLLQAPLRKLMRLPISYFQWLDAQTRLAIWLCHNIHFIALRFNRNECSWANNNNNNNYVVLIYHHYRTMVVAYKQQQSSAAASSLATSQRKDHYRVNCETRSTSCLGRHQTERQRRSARFICLWLCKHGQHQLTNKAGVRLPVCISVCQRTERETTGVS